MKEGIKFEGQITGKICLCLKLLIKTIGGENPVYQRNAYTCLQQIISQDSSRTSALSSVSCTRLWRRQGTEARITRIVWLPYPIPVPMLCHEFTLYKPNIYTAFQPLFKIFTHGAFCTRWTQFSDEFEQVYTHVSLYSMNTQMFKGYRCKSGIVLFERRVI